jgi:phage shock protein C
MSNNVKRLYRSRKERLIAGIGGGIGDYFGIDPTLVRLVFVILLILLFPAMLVIYLLMWIIIPQEPEATVVDVTSSESGES